MATLVLGTVGRALGGPLGGLAGTILGGVIDRGIFGGKAREGPRVANLTVQSAAYGEPLARLYGRMRVAGILVWTAGIKESRQRSGGGKRGPATTSYSYSASFAVIVSARAIDRIERIWADGKLLRAGDGGLIFPATIRTYHGDEAQVADPLITAAEGIAAAPAYRGRAYVVFEDLPLADYGNRIPNLTFEVVADSGGGLDAGGIAADVAGAAVAASVSLPPAVLGFAAARAGSIRQTLAELTAFADLPLRETAAGLAFGTIAAVATIARDDLGNSGGNTGFAWRENRQGGASVPDLMIVGFSDPARDFQPGQQRAVRRSPAVRGEQHDLAVALDAPAAKQLAETMLRRAIAARTTGQMTLPWRYAGLRAGDLIAIAGTPDAWRIRRWTLTGAAIDLEVERIAAPSAPVVPAADAGRAYDAGDAPQGATVFHVLDLPPLFGIVPTTPRLLVAAAGAGAGWRRTDIAISRDGGDSYAAAATVDAPATLGTVATVLPAGNTDRWDRVSVFDVELLADAMALESRDEAAVLAGANLALTGGEILQFATAEQIAPRRYRLSTLLRGRRGTEAEVARHCAGERFVLLEQSQLATIDLPDDVIGSTLLIKAAGPGEDIAALPALAFVPIGAALRPLSPVALTVARTGDGWRFAWIRRSRAGFAWIDGTDAPLGEDSERYRMAVTLDATVVRTIETAEPIAIYTAAQFAADGGGSAAAMTIAVAQVSSAAGPGVATARRIDLHTS